MQIIHFFHRAEKTLEIIYSNLIVKEMMMIAQKDCGEWMKATPVVSS